MPNRAFTVVIRTFNRRDYVAECVESVLAQTRPADQVIVVDDGSSDGTSAFLRDRFPHVLVLELENRGRSIAVNHGLAHAAHDWICLLDDDDLWHCDKLNEVERYLDANPDCQALNHPVWFFRDAHEGPTVTPYGFKVDFYASGLQECHAAVADRDPSENDPSYLSIRGNSYRMLLERSRGIFSASVVRKDVMIEAGALPPALAWAEDWLFYLNVARLAEWHTIPRRLGFWRIHSAQSASDPGSAAAVLAAHLVVWFGGRPLPERAESCERERALSGYQTEYRALAQRLIWNAVSQRDLAALRTVRRLARPLIQGRASWLLVHMPPPLTYRLSRSRRRLNRKRAVRA